MIPVAVLAGGIGAVTVAAAVRVMRLAVVHLLAPGAEVHFEFAAAGAPTLGNTSSTCVQAICSTDIPARSHDFNNQHIPTQKHFDQASSDTAPAHSEPLVTL